MTVKDEGAADTADVVDAPTPEKASETAADVGKDDADKGGEPEKSGDAEPAAKAKARTSVLDGDDDEEDEGDEPSGKESPDKKAVPQDFPDDWREKIAAGDEKLLKQLKRMKAPGDLAKKMRNLEAKLSSGDLAKKWDDTWSDEDKAKWREENGIPVTAADYKIPEIKGLDFDDTDKPALGGLFEAMHAANAPQAVVDKAIGWYHDYKSKYEETIVGIDAQDMESTEDELRKEWGNPEFKANTKLVRRLLRDGDVFPAGAEESIASARDAQGHRLINRPWFLKLLADVGISKYGEGALVPTEEVNRTSTRKAEIEAIRRQDVDKYYRERNSKGQTLEQEYREIMENEAKRKR